MDGFILLHRKIRECAALQSARPLSKFEAWIDLLMLANWKDSVIDIRGIKVSIKRGQVGWSEVQLAKKWKWSRNKLRRWFDELAKERMIERLSDLVRHQNGSQNELKMEQQNEQQNLFVTSIITITNYDKYQTAIQQNGTANGTADDTANGTQRIKEENKVKRKIKKTQYADDPLFEKFWEDYPCNGNTGIRGDKQRTFRFWLALQNGDRELAIQRLSEYKMTQSWIDGFSVHATKFLQETFRYPAPPPKLKSKNPHSTISQDFENKDYSDTGDFLNAEQFLENLKKKEV